MRNPCCKAVIKISRREIDMTGGALQLTPPVNNVSWMTRDTNDTAKRIPTRNKCSWKRATHNNGHA